MHIVIIGGGIVGLSSAFYLKKAGHAVTIIDQTDFSSSCSYGNAGYICPSHFIPLATPGIVKQGLRWMLNSQSPFYVQPRLDWSLIQWGWHFMRAATAKRVEAAAIPLRDISLLSRQEYAGWSKLPGFDFLYQQKGLLEIFQTEEKALHAQHTLEKAHELGLSDTKMLDQSALATLEPNLPINAIGALYFGCDAHCSPNQLMLRLIAHLQAEGVQLLSKTTAIDFIQAGKKIKKVIHTRGELVADHVVVATGSWSRQLLSSLRISIPMMPGRGYSITQEDVAHGLNYPAILVEGRVAVTPFSSTSIRFGGTMEITSHQTPPRINRVAGIVKAVKQFYPTLQVETPPLEKVWYGYRPCSADGLPYIGKAPAISNLTIATGHSMLGLSLGAGTGKLVREIVEEVTPSMDLKPFAVNRF
ncbi:MAG: FAD-dependent oxidoreductase [Bacteroidetes bacterium]|jgi:D-amino-acid dehydrogenase|nr:FAD-dependent oxidoreductase [Bacteroidota bacterium]GDX42852.1 amino acid dehydrogenase [Bacteroidota bacterium]